MSCCRVVNVYLFACFFQNQRLIDIFQTSCDCSFLFMMLLINKSMQGNKPHQLIHATVIIY